MIASSLRHSIHTLRRRTVFGDKRRLFAACMDISAVGKRPMARGNVAPCSALSSNRL